MTPLLVDPDLNAGCTWCGLPARVVVRAPPWRLGASNATLSFPAFWFCLRHWRQVETGERKP